MAINSYFTPTPWEHNLYAPPVDFISKSLEVAQKKYDTNFLAAEQLKDTYFPSLPQDRAKANAATQELNDNIDKVVSKYNGDYSQAGADLIKLQMDLKRRLQPGKDLGAIVSQYNNYSQSMKTEGERLAKNEVIGKQVNALQNWFMTNYKGVDQLKQADGSYSDFTIPRLNAYVSHEKIFEDAIAKQALRKTNTTEYKGKDKSGHDIYDTHEIDYKDPKEAENAVRNQIFNNDSFNAYYDQFSALQGIDPKAAKDNLYNQYVTQAIPSRTGPINDTHKYQFEKDEIGASNLDFSHKWALARQAAKDAESLAVFKNKLANEGSTGDGGLLDILGKTSIENRYKPVDPSTSVVSWGRGGASTGAVISVNQIIGDKNPRADVNVEMLKAIKQANPNQPDANVWLMYNNSLHNSTPDNLMYYNKFQTTKAMKEEADRVLPQLANGTANVTIVDSKTGVNRPATKDEIVQLYSDANDAKKRSAKIMALGKSSVSGGALPFGTVLASPNNDGKLYVVSENNLGIAKMQSDMNSAFNFIHDDTKQQGNLFKSPDMPTIPGMEHGAPTFGVKHYVFDPYTKIASPQIRYYTAKQAADGSYVPNFDDPFVVKDPKTGQKRYWDDRDMERAFLPWDEVIKTYPRNPAQAEKGSDTYLESGE